MRLRLGDAWRLGWANLAGHKARSVLTILTVSILFGLILGLNLVLQGLEKTILTASVEETAGKVYLKVEFDTGMSAKTMTDVELLDLGWVKKAEIIEAEAKTFGGKKAGTLTTLWGEQRVQIMSLEPGFQEVGEFSAIPGGQLELEGFNFLNWPLSGIYVISSLGSMVMIDDDLESTEDYLRKWIEERYRKAEENYVGMIAAEPDMNEEERRETYEYLRGGALKATRAMIIEFENTEDAVRYGLQEREGEMRHMAINDLFSNTVDAARSFASDEKSILILEIIL